MGWTAWEIPGWKEDARLREFFRNAMHPELILDIEVYRDGAIDGSEYAVRLRAALEYLLAERPADVGHWWSVTGFSFLTEDGLYGYLGQLYAYFYGGRCEPPVVPEY